MIGLAGAGKDTVASFLVESAGFCRIGFADALYDEVAADFAVSREFLGSRTNKETPTSELSLANATDIRFVEAALRATRKASTRRAAFALASGRGIQRGMARRAKKEITRPRTSRWTMQMWGTEFRRLGSYGVDSYWIDKVKATISESPDVDFVVTDVRFRNEAALVLALGGCLWRVRRPKLEHVASLNRLSRAAFAHSSETEMLDYPTVATFLNDEGSLAALRSKVLDVALGWDMRLAA